jgi:DNA-binding transcriptional MerR regulator
MNISGGDPAGSELAGRGPKYVITIGQLAGYAGVTIKAVRHYHERGLLAEPPRDASGYRRYSAEQAIELVKIKTLADAGVPLARIKELLAAGPDEVAAAIADIDRKLAERAEEIRRTRERIAGLSAGDRLFVSPQTADFLDRLRKAGVSERAIRMERDLWILMQSASPAHAAAWLADKLEAMDDPEFQAIYLEYDAAFDWPGDDPRLEALAERSQRWMRTRQPTRNQPRSPEDAAIARFITTSAAPSSSAWDRLAEIARERAAVERAGF